MSKSSKLTVIVVFTIMFTWLFYKQNTGINVLVFETLFIYWIWLTRNADFRLRVFVLHGSGLLTTAIFCVVNNTVFGILINILTLLVFTGMMIFPNARSVINTFWLSVLSIFTSQIEFFKYAGNTKLKGRKLGARIYNARIFIVPVVIILIFVFIYRRSNPVFDNLLVKTGGYLDHKLTIFFENFDFAILGTILLGLTVSNFLIIRRPDKNVIGNDMNANDGLRRIRKNKSRLIKMLALLNEYTAGVFLLIILNLVLLVLNCIDIRWVWFNFEWEGQYLKQFVHEGTYLLILSILISIALVLYYFRGNLNFLKRNKWLKVLSYIWLAQNSILTVSVAIRNFWYIKYFALAYKRIGVIIFLLVTLYGLYTVYQKVRFKKSAFFLFRRNAFFIFIALVLSSFINWDILIARYNFNHAANSFLHLDYMAKLSDKALPYLYKPLEELKKIEAIQKEKFSFEEKFMTTEEYHQKISERKKTFLENWDKTTIRSWNFAGHKAFKKLSD